MQKVDTGTGLVDALLRKKIIGVDVVQHNGINTVLLVLDDGKRVHFRIDSGPGPDCPWFSFYTVNIDGREVFRG